jgi:hypothetical protein
MSDIKLFELSPGGVAELAGESVQVEKSLQQLFEQHLERCWVSASLPANTRQGQCTEAGSTPSGGTKTAPP